MDVDNLLLSMKFITEEQRVKQTDINKIESDVSVLQSTGVNVNVSNQVTANSNSRVSSGAVYSYVNQKLSSRGTMATTFDTANNTDSVSGKLVSDYLVDNNYVTSLNPSSSAPGQVLTVNEQLNATWATPGTSVPTGGTTGQVLTVNGQGDVAWDTPSIGLSSTPFSGVADYVLAVDNSSQVVWVEAPKLNEYFYAKSIADKSVFPSGLKVLDNWTAQLSSSGTMFTDSHQVFTAPRTGIYRVRFDAEILHNTTDIAAQSELQIGIPYPLSTAGQTQLYSNLIPDVSSLVSYDFRTMVAAAIPGEVYNNVVAAHRSYDFRRASLEGSSSPFNLSFTESTDTNVQASNTDAEVVVHTQWGGTNPIFNSVNGISLSSGTSFIKLPATEIALTKAPNVETFSLEFYFKPSGGTSSSRAQVLFSSILPTGVNNNIAQYTHNSFLFIFYSTETGGLEVEGTDSNLQWVSIVQQQITFDTQFPQWEHLIVTYGNDNGYKLKIYKNGVLMNTSSITLFAGTPSDVRIGEGPGANIVGAPEYLRFFRFYQTTLSAAQVTSLFDDHAEGWPQIYNLIPPTVSSPIQQSNSAFLKGYSDLETSLSLPSAVNGITGTNQTWVELDPNDFTIPADGFTIEWYGIIGNQSTGNGLFDMYDPDPGSQLPTPTAPGTVTQARNRFGLWNSGAANHSNLMLYYENGVQNNGVNNRLHTFNISKTQPVHLVIALNPSAAPILYVDGHVMSPNIVYSAINYPPTGTRTYVTIGRRPDVDSGGHHAELIRALRIFPGVLNQASVKALYEATTQAFIATSVKGTGEPRNVNSGSQFISMEMLITLAANEQLAFAQKTDTGNHGTNANVIINSLN